MTKLISFPALKTLLLRNFLGRAPSIVKADAIVVNGVKTFLAKGSAINQHTCLTKHQKIHLVELF